MLFFFVKQKTAYEMRISDWSSDVCSSDLRRDDQPIAAQAGQSGRSRGVREPRGQRSALAHAARRREPPGLGAGSRNGRAWHRSAVDDDDGNPAAGILRFLPSGNGTLVFFLIVAIAESPDDAPARNRFQRSEEHTYELQSIMRISYSVFRLKK